MTPLKPLILAHRGLVTQFQENTLAAIQAALASPFCHGAECDVFLSQDAQVVLCHDDNLLRLTGLEASIYGLDWAQLAQLRVQKTLLVDGGTRQYASTQPLVLLRDVLADCQGKTNADGSLFFLDIELKATLPDPSKAAVGAAVARLVREFQMENQCVVSSFNYFMIHAAKKEHPALRTAIAYDDTLPVTGGNATVYDWLMNAVMESNALGELFHACDVVAEHTLLDADSIAKLHAKAMRVGSYTLFPLVCEPAVQAAHTLVLQTLATQGLDWVETDNVAMAYAALNAG